MSDLADKLAIDRGAGCLNRQYLLAQKCVAARSCFWHEIGADRGANHMIDTGQYSTATERVGSRFDHIPAPSQWERDLRNRAIETDRDDDWAIYRAVRDRRVTRGIAD